MNTTMMQNHVPLFSSFGLELNYHLKASHLKELLPDVLLSLCAQYVHDPYSAVNSELDENHFQKIQLFTNASTIYRNEFHLSCRVESRNNTTGGFGNLVIGGITGSCGIIESYGISGPSRTMLSLPTEFGFSQLNCGDVFATATGTGSDFANCQDPWTSRFSQKKNDYLAKHTISAHTIVFTPKKDTERNVYANIQHLIEEHHLKTEKDIGSCPRVFCQPLHHPQPHEMQLKVIYDPGVLFDKTPLSHFLNRLSGAAQLSPS